MRTTTTRQELARRGVTRRDRLLKEQEHDPYRKKAKLAEPTVCPQCSVVYHAGRWQWAKRPHGAMERLCPACTRIRDRYPGGFVYIAGSFYDEHRRDILNLIRNIEGYEKREHPLMRIIAVERRDGQVVVTTTEARLARAIGDALARAHEGQLDYQYAPESALLEVHWRR